MNAIILVLTFNIVVLFGWMLRMARDIEVMEARLAQARIALMVAAKAIDDGDAHNMLESVVVSVLQGHE